MSVEVEVRDFNVSEMLGGMMSVEINMIRMCGKIDDLAQHGYR